MKRANSNPSGRCGQHLERSVRVEFVLTLTLLALIAFAGQQRARAANGDATSQFEVALNYFHGVGVPKNYAEAARLFRAAAEQGYAPAQLYLSFCYENGRGEPEDLVEAYKWLLLASAQGNEPAGRIMATLEEKLTPGQMATGQHLASKFITLTSGQGRSLIVNAQASQNGATDDTRHLSQDFELFRNGQRLVFDTTGHQKANGIRSQVSYPRTWKAVEGDRPHIIQKLISEEGQGSEMLALQTVPLPAALARVLTEKEKLEAVSLGSLTNFVPAGGRLLAHTVSKLDGETCGIMEYAWANERAGMQFSQMGLVFVVPMKGALLVIAGVTGGPSSSGFESIARHYATAKPLLTMMASSCVFPDKWTSGIAVTEPEARTQESPGKSFSSLDRTMVSVGVMVVLVALACWGIVAQKHRPAMVLKQEPTSPALTEPASAAERPNLAGLNPSTQCSMSQKPPSPLQPPLLQPAPLQPPPVRPPATLGTPPLPKPNQGMKIIDTRRTVEGLLAGVVVIALAGQIGALPAVVVVLCLGYCYKRATAKQRPPQARSNAR